MNYYLRKPAQRKRAPLWSIAAVLLLLGGVFYGVYYWSAVLKEAPKETAAVQRSGSEPIRDPVIGVMAPFSGPLKREGDAFREGTELAWRELQSRGLQGEMLFRDGGKEEAEVLRGVQELLSDPRLTVIVAHLPMTVLSRVIPDCQRQKVILVVPASSHEALADSPWVLPFIASDRSEGVQAAGITGDLAKGTKIALLYDPGPYGELLQQGFREGAAKNSMDHQSIACKTDDPGLRGALSEKLPPETSVVFLAGSPLWGTAVADVLSELGFQGRLLLPQSYGKMPLDDLADKFPDRLFVLKPLLTEGTGNAALENFQKAFVRTYWKKPDEPALLAYDAMNWVGNALKEGTVTREQLRDRLRSGANAEAPYRGAAGEAFFDAHGRVQRRMQLTLYRNGRFLPPPPAK